MTLIWAVPVVAAAAAALVLVATARALEDSAAGLARDVGRLNELAAPLAAVQATVAETDELAAGFRARHATTGQEGPSPASPDGTED